MVVLLVYTFAHLESRYFTNALKNELTTDLKEMHNLK